MGGDVEDPPTLTRRRDPRAGGSCRPTRRWCSTPARSRPTRASTCCSRRRRGCRRRIPTARVLVVGGSDGQVAAARARAAALGAAHGGLHRPAAGARDPGVRRRRDGAGVAAHPRHQHAAQDLLVPALGRADRRHQPADPHPGADARRGPARRRRRPAPFAAGDRRAARRSGGADARWRRRPAGSSDAKYSREVYLGPHRRGAPAGWPARGAAVAGAARRARSPRSGDGAGHRRDRFHRRPPGRHAGPPRARGAGAGARRRASSAFAPPTRPPPASVAVDRRSQHARRARARLRAASRSSTTSPRPTAKPGQPDAAYRAINVDGTRTCSRRARAAGRPARRALLDRRRARAHRASAGQRGRAVQSRRRLPGDQARRPRRWPATYGQAHGLDVVVARPIGIHGPGDTRFLKMFRGLARGRFPMLGSGEVVLPPHLHRRPGRGLPAVRRGPGGRRAHLHPRRRALHDLERAGRAGRRGAGRDAAAAAPAGLAGVARRPGVRDGLRAAADRAAALSAAGRLLHQEPRLRHHPGPHRARLRARRSTCARASGGRLPGIGTQGWL